MNERLKILQMLEDGSITAEEAAKLLSQVPPSKQESEPKYESREENVKFLDIDHDGDFLDRIRNLFGGFGGIFTQTKYITLEISATDCKRLVIEALNGKIDIEGGNEDGLFTLKCGYIPKWQTDPEILLTQKDGVVRLKYDKNDFRSLSVSAYIPQIMYDELKANTSNAAIELEGVGAKRFRLETVNGAIDVSDCNFEKLTADTANMRIELEECTGNSIEARTTNAKVEIEECKAHRILVKTTNAKIELEDVTSSDVSLETTNASISIEEIVINEGEISTHTTNGSISIAGFPEDAAIKADLKTSNGVIKWKRDSAPETAGKKRLEYEERGARIIVKAHTTNGNIRIE